MDLIHDVMCKRFYLRDGQFYGNVDNNKRNLYWYLNDERFGFGDLSPSDILIISSALEPGEVFSGYNERHMTPYMDRENPVVVINCQEVKYPEPIGVSKETRAKVNEIHRWK
jgi:hypothetical protein